jgi:hypothetical protein
MQVFVHGQGSESPEVIEVEETVMVRELLAGRDGELVWVEEVDVPVELDVTLAVAGIGHGHHVHRGPCREIEVRLFAGEKREAAHRFAPSAKVERAVAWGAGNLGLGPAADVEAVDRRTDRVVDPGSHIGSLAGAGTCSAELDLRPVRRDVRIYVNTRPDSVPPGQISFEQVVEFAFPVLPFGENTELTVSYRNGPPEHPKGSLLPGGSVTVREEMSFLVSATDKS